MKTNKNSNSEKKYCIVAETNGWIANRDARFNGKTRVVVETGLTLKEANKQLLGMLNKEYDANYPNWGVAVNATKENVDSATPTFSDGTRSFEYDSRRFYTEEVVCEIDLDEVR